MSTDLLRPESRVDSTEVSPPVQQGSRVPQQPQPNRSAPAAQEPVDKVNLSQAQQASQLTVTYHVDNHEVYFQVIDSQSGKVVRQVPPEEVLSDQRSIAEYLKTLDRAQTQKG